MKMVVKKVPQGSPYKVNDRLDFTGTEIDTLTEAGHEFISASEYDATQQAEAVKAQARNQVKILVVQAVDRAVSREALVPKGETANSAETVTARAMKQIEQGADADFVVAAIDGIPGKDQIEAAQRITRYIADGNHAPARGSGLLVTGVDIKDASAGYVKAMETQDALCKSNRWDEALQQSREASVILSQHHLKASDLVLTDAVKGATRFDPRTVKAATFSDPNSQVGALAGDVILMRNLGFLKAKLNWMPYLSTDLSGEPAKFGQSLLTRYIVPPGVLTWAPGVGFTSDASTIAAAGAGTTQSGATTQSSGTVTKSVPSTVDKSVTLNKFKAVEVEFPVSLISGTMRNLFAEQYSAQLYSLGLHINQDVLAGMFSSTWGTNGIAGLAYSYVKALGQWNLAGMIGVKNKLTIAQIPDVGRFALMHSFYHDKILEDSNLLSAKAILSLIKKDASSFEDGEIPTLFGVKPLESQIASATDAGVLTSWVNDQDLGTTNIVGFSGNMSAYLFVSRPPQDWTTTLTQLGIPSTASIRLVTEPESGLTVMVFSYADNGKMSISQRVCLMWGHAQGDPRSGILLKAA